MLRQHTEALIACRECDLLHYKRPLHAGETARCQRCHALLYRHQPQGLEHSLALLLSALVLYALALSFPFLSLQVQGHTHAITLLASVAELQRQQMQGLALFTGAILLLAPLLRIGGLLSIIMPLYFHYRPAYAPMACRMLAWLTPWSMMEIYLIGVLVALVKLTAIGTIILGAAFWAFILLVVCMTWVSAHLDHDDLWHKLTS
jgi:paraquat-inducible protein A